MSRRSILHVRLRSLGSRLSWAAIGSGLAAGLAIQLAAALIFSPPPGIGAPSIRDDAALMASASLAALIGAAVAGALAQHRPEQNVALNAYVSWLATSVVLMMQIAATTHVLSA